MKYLCVLPFLFAVLPLTRSGAENAPLLSVKIALPAFGDEIGKREDRELTYPNYKGELPHFSVIITNVSDLPQRVISEGCSWGDHALSFEFTDEDGETHKAQKLGVDYSKNVLSWWTLQPNESVVFEVYYRSGWHGFPRPPAHKSETLTMRAVFEMEPFGRIVSEPLKIVIKNDNDEAPKATQRKPARK